MASDDAIAIDFVIRSGRVIDPPQDLDLRADVEIQAGRIAGIGADSSPCSESIDASGLIVCPGLIDIHVHLREPGGEHKETIETGTKAAAAGGFTAVACMPNTNPTIDSPDSVRSVLTRAGEIGVARVFPIAAITQGRAGNKLTNMKALTGAGAVAFSDDGDGVEDDELMAQALATARDVEAVVIQHCEYKSISAGGVMHLGNVSRRLGLPGLDPRSEEAMIERDLELLARVGGRYHVAHVSTAKAVDLIRVAKADGLPVTAEVCPHHLLLTDEACADMDPNSKMHPPLRSQEDVNACKRGLVDGTIDCIATDHAPHAIEEKSVGFQTAPPGIIGLETALPLTARAMVLNGLWGWPELIRRMSTEPARVLNLPGGSMVPGAAADVTIIDSEAAWRIDPKRFRSKSRNTPFAGLDVQGRVVATILDGRLIYLDDEYKDRIRGFDNSVGATVKYAGDGESRLET